jgi:hypothetical protein
MKVVQSTNKCYPNEALVNRRTPAFARFFLLRPLL